MIAKKIDGVVKFSGTIVVVIDVVEVDDGSLVVGTVGGSVSVSISGVVVVISSVVVSEVISKG